MLSEDWYNRHVPMQYSGIRVANIIDGSVTKAKAPDPDRLFFIYGGWSDDEIRAYAENGGNTNDLRAIPGLPPGESIDCSSMM